MKTTITAIALATVIAAPALAGSHTITFGSHGTFTAEFAGDYAGTNMVDGNGKAVASRSWLLENATGWSMEGAAEAAAAAMEDERQRDDAVIAEDDMDVVVEISTPVVEVPQVETEEQVEVEAQEEKVNVDAESNDGPPALGGGVGGEGNVDISEGTN